MMRLFAMAFLFAVMLFPLPSKAGDITGKYVFKDNIYLIKMDITKSGTKYSVLLKGTGGRDKFDPDMPTHSSYIKTDKCSYSGDALICEYYNKEPLYTGFHNYNFKITFKNNSAILEQTGGERDAIVDGNYGGVIVEQTYQKVK